MKGFADLTAVGVMCLLAYAFFAATPAFSEAAPIATLIAAASCGACALYVWHGPQANRLLSLGWTFVMTCWGVAFALFVVACWLVAIPIVDGLFLPTALWQWHQSNSLDWWRGRIFWTAMYLGPGIGLIAIGTIVRSGILKLTHAP